MSKQNIKKGDKVKIIAGNSRGKISTVLEVNPKESKVLVEGIAMVSKHLKPTSANPNGTISKKEMPIHISNVMLVDSAGQPTRIGRRVNKDNKNERFSVKSGNTI